MFGPEGQKQTQENKQKGHLGQDLAQGRLGEVLGEVSGGRDLSKARVSNARVARVQTIVRTSLTSAICA